MKAIYQIPLFFISLSLISGMLCYQGFTNSYLKLLIIIPPILVALWVVDRSVTKRIVEHLFTAGSLIAFFILGVAFMHQHKIQNTNQLETINCQTLILGGTINSQVKTNTRGYTFTIETFGYQKDSTSFPIQGQVKVYLDKDHGGQLSMYDSLFVRGNLSTLNSYHKDYIDYMNSQGVYHVFYGDTVQSCGRSFSFQAQATYIQDLLSDRFNELIHDEEIRSIALAMFLGDKTSISPELREGFAVAGASHILAISGMHIGIVYLILNLLLSGLHMIPKGKKIKYTLILLILIIYMGVTGASPAVVRATLMFGILLIMKLFSLRHHILNIVALAALIQILINPSIVFTVSFQLSYLAVCGIITLYPQLEKCIQTPWKALNHLYSWIGITLCATMATAPLIWIHFGTFPVYFLLTNIMISLLSVGIVWVGFVLVISIYIPILSNILAYIAILLLNWLINIITWISGLPHAQLTELSIYEPGIKIILIELAIAIIIMLPGFIRPVSSPPKKIIWT